MSKLLDQLNGQVKNRIRLSDVAEIVPGFSFKSSDFVKEGVPLVKITEIQSPYVILDKCSFVDIAKYQPSKLSKFYLREGEYVVAMTGATVGKVGKIIYKNKLLLNQRVAVIRPTSRVSKDFINIQVASPKFDSYIKRIASGSSAQANISATDIGNFEFHLPDFLTQTKIADILGVYDAKIENNNSIIKNLENTAQAIFDEWFVKFRFPGYEKVKMVDGEMGGVPENWSVKKLDESFDISIGRTPPRQEQQWFSRNPKDMKWISIKDMGSSGVYIFSTDEFLTKNAVIKFNIPLIPKNTLVVSFKLTIGRLAITTEEMLSNEAIAHIKSKNDLIPVEYIYLFLKKYNFDSLGSTSSIANAVNSKSIKNIQILVPEENMLKIFKENVQPFFIKIFLIQKENILLRLQRDQLLLKLI